MRHWIPLICVISLLSCLFLVPARQPQRGPSESVWFVLEEEPRGKLSIDPVAKLVGGKLMGVPDGCDAENPDYKKFEALYLRPGQTYSVLFGGAPAGIAGLRHPDPDFGNNLVEYDGIANIRGQMMALATNAPHPASETSSRQGPSADERKFAVQLANQQFSQRGLSAALLSKIKTENLTHTILAPRKTPALIGSATLAVGDESGLVHGMFFIAESKDNTIIPEFVWVNLSQAEAASEVLKLVDQADLFGDGEEEIVAVLGYYENYRYRIYRRTKDGDHWRQIFETEVLGCL